MNIFALSKDPSDAAKQVLDKHVIKMPTETCQMLHTNILYMQYVHVYGEEPQLKELKAFHKEIGSELMKPAMLNHPSTIWARQSRDNFKWLFVHGRRLCHEYTWRYNKKHGSQVRIENVWKYKELLREHSYPAKELTPVTIAMDDMYRIKNTFDNEWDFVIESYRHYYLEGKWRIAEWRQDRRPEWFPANHYATKYNVGVRAYNSTNPKYPMTELEE